MLKISLFSIIILLSSCKDKRLQQYEQIVNDVDRFAISYKDISEAVAVPEYQTEGLKDILKRHIKPELQRKATEDIRIDFYKNNTRIAFLTINRSSNPFVNFDSENLHFGFWETYGIGMFISNFRN